MIRCAFLLARRSTTGIVMGAAGPLQTVLRARRAGGPGALLPKPCRSRIDVTAERPNPSRASAASGQPACRRRAGSAESRSFSSALLMMRSSSGGISGFSRTGAAGARFRMASKITPEVSPRKGSAPVAIS